MGRQVSSGATDSSRSYFIVLMSKCDPPFFVDTYLGGFTRSCVSPCCPRTGCSQELSFSFNLVSEKRLGSLFSPQSTLFPLP